MSVPVALLSLATAIPPYDLPQEQAVERARQLFDGSFPAFERMTAVFKSSGIDHRQLVQPPGWYRSTLDWPERSAAYLAGATDLFVAAATKALAEAGLGASSVDIVVTVSSTGIATPSLEAQASARMGFRPDIARVPVFGLGCAGGVTGLGLAARLARSTPGATVLLVVVETCSLALRTTDVTKADVVAAALFGDGAAAAILRTGTDGFAQVAGMAEHSWPDTLDIMGWRVEASGLGVIFDRAIPPFVHDNIHDAVGAMLDRQGLSLGDIDRFICHPGGTKVVEALEQALALGAGALDQEREVLRDHGNMSAPTALFVLDRVRRREMPPLSLLMAMGPGFTASTVTLERPQ
jgi:alkylresorcinol/alkylpyrone synthase